MASPRVGGVFRVARGNFCEAIKIWKMKLRRQKIFFEKTSLYRGVSSDILLYRTLEDKECQKNHDLSGFFGESSNRSSYIPRKKISVPPLNFFCPVCQRMQTYKCFQEIPEYSDFCKTFHHVRYSCVGCGEDYRDFFVRFFEKESKIKRGKGFSVKKDLYVMKVGQYPEWSIDIPKSVQKFLGEHSALFKKGLICESQSYGIGAYAYYRRVLEKCINSLLDSITNLVEEGKERNAYVKHVESAKKEKNAEKRIEIAKEFLPKSLWIDGMNPLRILYSALSENLHNGSDEECLEFAESIRSTMLYLVEQIASKKQGRDDAIKGMKKILEKFESKKTSE